LISLKKNWIKTVTSLLRMHMRSFLNHVARIGKKTILFWKIREEVEPFIWPNTTGMFLGLFNDNF
jgi:hypothetical protein